MTYKVEPLRGSAIAILKSDGFSRYHAARQVAFDKRASLFGGLMYVLMGSTIWSGVNEATLTSKLIVAALALHTLWATVLHALSPDAYLRWRDALVIQFFLVHHVISPWLIMPIGFDARDKMPVGNSPVGLFFVMLVSRTLLWACLNVLMYRVKLRNFLIWQPLILAAAFPLENDMCRWAAEKHTDLAVAAYGTLRAWGRVVMAAGTPGATLGIAGTEGDHYDYAYNSCIHVQFFTNLALGFCIPAFIIRCLEAHTWQSFMRADPRSLKWPGGPSVNDIHTGQLQLRYEEAGKASEKCHLDHRVGAVLFIGSVVVWHVVEFIIVYK